MRDTEFVRDLLRVEDPWDVVESKLDLNRQRVDVRIEWFGPGRCPVCGAEVPKHDHRERVWRDLDLCADQLFIHALVPRVDCPEHGILTVKVPWAQGRTEFTDRFEAVVIAFLGEMSIAGLLRDLGNDAVSLKGTKYDWLRNPRNMDHSDKIALARLRGEYDKVGRAWTLKELFSGFWEYRRESAARTFFDAWYGWAVRSRLPAIVKVAKMIKRHFENVISYLRLRITNAAAEGLNSKIQWIKYQARGFRSEDRFERAILFHCGGLDLLPTHHNS